MLNTLTDNPLKSVFILVILSILIITIIVNGSKFIKTNNQQNYISPQATLPTPQVSGWIPWWDEQKGFDLLQKFPNKIHSVSPVWFTIDKNLKLSDVGTVNRIKVIEQLKNLNVKILPSLGSELNGDKLSPLLNDPKKINLLIPNLIGELKSLDVDGVDIDLEGIKKEDKEKFTQFLSKLSSELKKNSLYLSVAVHAQTDKVTWEGVEGQDLERIGKIADEVRIMIYDEHSAGTEPGSIASLEWINNVIQYNLKKISIDKIVIGVPSYGYIWAKDDSKGLQFYEFNQYLEAKKYDMKRDSDSGELVFKGENFSGWLSDSEAMIAKVNLIRSLGINKFIIWHLAGLDEKFFYENWQR